MKNFKQHTITLVSCLLAALLIWIMLVVIVDPYFQYHEPLSFFPYKIDDQLTQNPGMARNLNYNAVILGSSVTVNFDTAWFNEDFNVNAVKLPFNGAYPKDYANIISQIESSGNELKYVFWTMDVASFSADISETKYPVKKNLYDTNPFNDINYLLNKDVFFEYIVFPFLANPGNNIDSSLANAYSTYQDLNYGKEACLNNFISTNPEIDTDKLQSIIDKKADENILLPDSVLPKDTYIENARINLDNNILPFIESHPDTQFIISFPPYSILSWLYYINDGSIYALREEYNFVISELSKYNNVTIYYFCDEEDIIYNLDLYADSIHYNRDINYFMEQEFTKPDSKYILH